MEQKKEKEIKVFNNYLYWVHFGENVGSEQSLDRPALVVRSTKESPVCIVLPVTLERLNDNIPYHVDLSNGKGTVLIEQIRTIDKQRIFDNVYYNHSYATINDDDYNNINNQLESMCMLKPLFKKKEKNVLTKVG